MTENENVAIRLGKAIKTLGIWNTVQRGGHGGHGFVVEFDTHPEKLKGHMLVTSRGIEIYMSGSLVKKAPSHVTVLGEEDALKFMKLVIEEKM